MKRINQSGAVSIVSVVIFITIITVVVFAYLLSSLSQQRNAVNFDMGTRAYYAAESGIQDAVRAMNPGSIVGKEDCKPFNGGSSGKLGASAVDYGLDYTCQIIDPTPADITGVIEPGGKTAMVKIEPASVGNNPGKLVIKWSQKTDSGEEPLIPRDDGTQSLKKANQWSSNAGKWHSMLRLTVIDHPLTGPFSRANINQRVAFLNPVKDDVSLTFDKNLALSPENLISDAKCERSDNASSEYSCTKSITLTGYDFNAHTLYVRIGAIYRTTEFSLQIIDSANNPIQLNNAQVVVDVTGRAKNVYRRVKQAFPLTNYVEDTETDSAVIAGEGICKNFSVTTVPTEFFEQCDPLN